MEISRNDLKSVAKSSLKGRWGDPIVVTLIVIVLYLPASIIPHINKDLALVGNILSLLIAGAVNFGVCCYFLAFVKNPGQPGIGTIFSGFAAYIRSTCMYLWLLLWIILWCLLLIVPGIIKSFAYSQCFFILAENPSVSPTTALKLSIKMTEGHKWDVFVFYLSFLGWILLGLLPCGIGLLWVVPYMATSMTNLYLKLKEMGLESGAITSADLGGSVQEAAPAS